jgi:hypothetical protein
LRGQKTGIITATGERKEQRPPEAIAKSGIRELIYVGEYRIFMPPFPGVEVQKAKMTVPETHVAIYA